MMFNCVLYLIDKNSVGFRDASPLTPHRSRSRPGLNSFDSETADDWAERPLDKVEGGQVRLDLSVLK